MSDVSITAPGAAAKPPAKLDELMLAMDVVDTLRHQNTVVDRELAQADRDAELKERLRQIYRGQGIEVPDKIIESGIAALKESRFAYTPPSGGFGHTVASLWVHRGTWGKLAGAGVLGLVLAWGGYVLGVERPARLAAENARIELAETLPRQLQAAADAAIAESRVEPARERARAALAGGQAAVRRGDAAAARAAIAEIDQLTATLREEYQLRIASLQNEQTGFFREAVRGPGRRYFLVVNALDSAGRATTRLVTNEEDNTTERVSRFAVGVPQQVWDAVRADKQRNGIVQNNRLGEKRRGELDVTWLMPVAGGTLTRWN